WSGERNEKALVYGALISQSQAVIIMHAIELLETQGICTLQKYLSRQKENPEQGKSAKELFKDERWTKIMSEASSSLIEDHPKIPRLQAIISKQLEKKNPEKVRKILKDCFLFQMDDPL
ncbi:MAG: hypothetical protein M1368_09890, partial [Thaumarchaeota archaeon]|nr:hypothetical protein [Nitrososphaerota archaeon]